MATPLPIQAQKAPMSEPGVVVVGAGMAGLVSALLLAQRGVRVTVVDSADNPGGKMRQLQVDGAAIDSGPTVFTMRWVFDRIFDAAGTSLARELSISPLSVLARHAWADGSRLDLHADPLQSIQAVAEFAGPDEAQRFERFCQQARLVHDTLEGPFIRSPSPTLLQMARALGPSGLRVLLGMGVMPSLWRSLGQHFRDPRLQQLFGRYATYCGSSPWQAPATLMLIAQVEMDGVWSVDGGMHALAQCLARLGAQRGVQFRYGQSVRRIRLSQGRACGVQLASGEALDAQAVVFNGDVAALRDGLLGEGDLSRAVKGQAPERSLSAITWSINAPTSGFALERHNVFFQDDYASEFTDIFDRARLPHKPTVYVCAQDRGLTDTPIGPERLLCLVNAPALGDSDNITPEAIDQCEQASFQWLQRCGLQVSLQSHNHVRTTPAQFHQLFPATGGALYGQATHGWMSAFARSNSASRIPGLFLAGGSVHPGPGVPMAALSGQLAAEAVMAHRALTKRYHPVLTSGGMSTP